MKRYAEKTVKNHSQRDDEDDEDESNRIHHKLIAHYIPQKGRMLAAAIHSSIGNACFLINPINHAIVQYTAIYELFLLFWFNYQ